MAEYEASFDSQFAVDKATGEFIHALIMTAKPKRVLELGTWRGASAIYIADALKQNGAGHVTTVERSISQVLTARANIDEAGLANYVTVIHDEIDRFLSHYRETYDFVFMDAMKSKTAGWLDLVLQSHMHPRGRILIDDVVKDADKMADVEKIIATRSLKSELYQIGNGLLLVHAA